VRSDDEATLPEPECDVIILCTPQRVHNVQPINSTVSNQPCHAIRTLSDGSHLARDPTVTVNNPVVPGENTAIRVYGVFALADRAER
jgi:hypothetical protein